MLKYATRFLALAVVTVFMATISLAKAQAADNLIGYWNFDEPSGTTVADSSSNSNNGTITGSGVSHSANVPAITCFNDPASIAFDGSGGYASIPNNSSMDPASQISISFWMNPNTVSNGFQHIIFKQGPVVTSYGVWLANDHVYMEDNDNSVRSLTSNATLTVGQWYYVTVTYDGTTQKLYINGQLDNSQSLPGITLTYENSPVKIGSGDYNNPFSGYVDDLRIYGIALTQSQVTDLAGGGCGPGVVSTVPTVVNFVDDQTNKNVSIEAPSTCTLSGLSSSAESGNAVSDRGYTYPAGFINYTANCGTPGFTATITLTFYGLTDQNLILRKYNPSTRTYTTVSGASISLTSIGGQPVTEATYQVTDGGLLDADGLANGNIVDPVGLALPVNIQAPNTGMGHPLHNADNSILTGIGLTVTMAGVLRLLVGHLGWPPRRQ